LNILITRPEPGASATAAKLKLLGHTPFLAPCLTITARAPKLPAAPAAIIVTSQQAIPALAALDKSLPIFCVGDATAARLRKAGFTTVHSANGDARSLFKLIIAHALPGTHLLASGEGNGQQLGRQLSNAGIAIARRAVYAATPATTLPPDAIASLTADALHAALFYSAETARVFTSLAPLGTANVIALALSQAVADTLSALPWSEIRVALAPTEADLLALLT
jgi:uroporphyrinogen-III synthase